MEHDLDQRLPHPRSGLDGGAGDRVHDRQRHRLREGRARRGARRRRVRTRPSFFWNVHNDFFEEVAKFRAARRIWSRIMRDRFSAKDPLDDAALPRADRGQLAHGQQIDNNVVRVTMQALPPRCSAARNRSHNGKDEALAPTEDSARPALRTQVIANESGAADTIDPLSRQLLSSRSPTSSGAARSTTSSRSTAWAARVVHRAGFMQREIQNSAYRYQQRSKAHRLVGVNAFTLSASRCRRSCRSSRSSSSGRRPASPGSAPSAAKPAADALVEVERIARDGGNLMPPIVAAVRAYCTLGEISTPCDACSESTSRQRCLVSARRASIRPPRDDKASPTAGNQPPPRGIPDTEVVSVRGRR